MKRIYSLWLLPEESVNKKYQKVISDVAISCRTQRFKPHITLINLNIEEKEVILFTNELIKKLKPIRTKLMEFGYSDKKYRSLYITVLKTLELAEAHNEVNRIFGHKKEFTPHLSIVYSELLLTNKLKIIKSLKPLNKEFFILNKLAIYDITEENPDLWEEICCYDLKL